MQTQLMTRKPKPGQPSPPFYRHVKGDPISGLSTRIHDLIVRRRAATDETERRRLLVELVKINEPLARAYAGHYRDRGIDFEDLVQEANLGLLQAIERFDPSLGFTFSTYAVWWIRHFLARYTANHGRLVRIPICQIDLHRRLVDIRGRLSRVLGRPATDAEVALAAPGTGYVTGGKEGFTVGDVSRSFAAWQSPISVHGGDPEIGDALIDRISFQVTPDVEADTIDRLSCKQLAALVRKELTNLPPREAYIIRMRAKDTTLAEIADHLGLTRERVRQIQMIATKKLQRRLRRKLGECCDI